MNNLTNEERARIFAMYMPCGIVQGDTSFNSGRKLVAVGGLETKEMQWGKLCNSANIANSFVSGFKLLLNPLSKITDEHAIEVAKIFDKEQKWKVSKRQLTMLRVESIEYSVILHFYRSTFKVEIIKDGISSMKESKICGDYYIIEIYDHLRELGYALPYKGKSLFELGIAVDRTLV